LWGPFHLDNTNEFKVGTYDSFTESAVLRFQWQATIQIDGSAGMETAHRLDGILVAAEKFPFIGPPSP
jgi:hypothetical protein